ncbi:MAG TPA: glutamate racemase [Aquifex aeolicus]|nr:glutamate racemase [Aquifex aeolicus]
MRIGIFDSGVGGLTVLKAIRDRYAEADIIYLGDTARVPYGNKSEETVIRYSMECADFLLSKGIDILVVACNTASSYAINPLRERFSIPVVGVVKPGVKLALSLTNGRVGVIGTLTTIRSGSYQIPLKEAGVEVFARACPLLVPLVEEGLFEGEIVRKVVSMYLKDLKGKIDTLILGCTHYPLLKNVIQDFLGDVLIVDSSKAVACELEGFVKGGGGAKTELFFTDMSPNLPTLVEIILGQPLEIKAVSPQSFFP